MRILHVGWGFSPWRSGGLIFYAEDLMAAQVARGHEVGYFFSGRFYPRIGGPRLKRWRRHGVAMHEVVNAPLVPGEGEGTRDPERELNEERMEAAFRGVLRERRPDVVHFQELHGLPSSLVDVAAEAAVPTLMTLQDYFPLCSTVRLVDADGAICTRLEVGEDCVARNAAAPEGPERLIARTIDYEKARLRRRLRVPDGANFRMLNPLLGALYRRAAPPAREGADGVEPPKVPDAGLAAAFQRRRDVNVERLGRVSRLVAQSPRLAEIYRDRGVDPDRMRTLRFTLAHIERLRPRTLTEPPEPVVFATLNGCVDRTKGSHVVAGALRALTAAGMAGRFRLLVFGRIDGDVLPELESHESVELRGAYEREDVGDLLDEVDVGIMPSVWEEAFAYAGVEMLAKGIPLIANPLGGMVEYAREGETAWLNRSCSADGLAAIVSELIDEPARVLEMHRRVIAAHDEIVLPMERHVDAIEALYRELAA
jgi:glycosyltransferase involved in cell wall biosynthesis